MTIGFTQIQHHKNAVKLLFVANSWHFLDIVSVLLMKVAEKGKWHKNSMNTSFLVRFMDHENQTSQNHHWEADIIKSPWKLQLSMWKKIRWAQVLISIYGKQTDKPGPPKKWPRKI